MLKIIKRTAFASIVLAMLLSCLALVACNDAGGDKTDVHDLTLVAAVPATCTDGGNKEYYTCSHCDKIFADKDGQTETSLDEVAINALGHDLEDHAAQAPTCGDAGWDAYVSCKREDCDYTTKAEISATGDHTEGEGATCEHKAVCAVCGNEYGEPLGHDFDTEFTVDKQPSCTEEGSKSKHCSRCSEKFEVTPIEMLSHTGGTVTCTEKAVCSVCGNEYGEPLGHDFATIFSVDKEASCTEEGSKSKHCSRCDEKSEVTPIEMISHTGGTATCTEKAACSVCGNEYGEPLGHDFDTEFTVDKQPSCTEEGSKSKHCSRCDEKSEVTPINATGHSPATAVENRVEPTYYAEGKYDTVERCNICNAVISSVETKIRTKIDNTSNQMIRVNATATSFEFDRQTTEDKKARSQFKDGVTEKLVYYIYASADADKDDYAGKLVLENNFLKSEDGVKSVYVSGQAGNYFGSEVYKILKLIEYAVSDFDASAQYYFAVEEVVKADSDYISAGISDIGSFCVSAAAAAPANNNNQMIRFGVNSITRGRTVELDRQGTSVFADATVMYAIYYLYEEGTIDKGDYVARLKFTKNGKLSTVDGLTEITIAGTAGNFFSNSYADIEKVVKAAYPGFDPNGKRYGFAVATFAKDGDKFTGSEISDIGTSFIGKPHAPDNGSNLMFDISGSNATFDNAADVSVATKHSLARTDPSVKEFVYYVYTSASADKNDYIATFIYRPYTETTGSTTAEKGIITTGNDDDGVADLTGGGRGNGGGNYWIGKVTFTNWIKQALGEKANGVTEVYFAASIVGQPCFGNSDVSQIGTTALSLS